LLRDNLRETAYALLDRFRLWRLGEQALRDQIDLQGQDILHRYLGRQAVVLLCPHFAGLEAAGQRLILEGPGMTLYNPQPDPHFDAVCRHGRQRFGVQLLLPVGASLLPLARRLQRGVALLLLPDLAHGEPVAPASHLFDPDAGTGPLAAWCAARLGAVLLPVTVLRCGGRYSVTVHEPLPDHAGDVAATTHTIRVALESLVRQAPQQYLWALPRAARPAANKASVSAMTYRQATPQAPQSAAKRRGTDSADSGCAGHGGRVARATQGP
jgi:Kdo2-lipid IVA lauroyltransferase/acyltransferase